MDEFVFILDPVIATFCNGLGIAPLLVSTYGVAETAVLPEQITETLAWVFAGSPIGGAMATSLPYFRTWNRLRSAS
jgi:formate/nitrite transporter FocA (FNT family)